MVAQVRGFLIGAAIAALSACGNGEDPTIEGAPPGLPDLGLVNVETENAAARERMISEDGGAISVTGANDVVYTLTIPEGALIEDTVIGLYPVTDVTTLPGNGTPAAAVHFVPDGLELLRSATLVVEFPAGTNVLDLVNVGYEADGQGLSLDVLRNDNENATVTTQISHFSGAILVTGDEALTALGIDGAVGSEEFLNQIANASRGFATDDPAVTAAVLPIYVAWYQQIVRLSLQIGAIPGGSLLEVDRPRQEYEAWLGVARITGIMPLLGPQLEDSIPLAAAYLRARYAVYNQACLDDPNGSVNAPLGPVGLAARAMGVGTLARAWSVPLAANQLDDEFLLDNLCVKLRFDTLLPTGLDRPGDSGSLIVGTHYTIAGGAARTDLPMRVALSREGAPIGTPAGGVTDAAGFFQTNLAWPEGVDPLVIDALVRIDRNGRRAIARFDRLTIGCTPARATAVTPLRVGRKFSTRFQATVTGIPASFEWDFGGGVAPNSSTAPSPVVVPGEPGTFSGSLTLNDDCGSTVFPFTYEVVTLPFISYAYAGVMEEPFVSGNFEGTCIGPGTARFNFGVSPARFELEYGFDCADRPERSLGTKLVFAFDEFGRTDTTFATLDGRGSGTASEDHLSFEWDGGGGIIVTFEGDVRP